MNAVGQQLPTCSDICLYDHFILYYLLLEQGKYEDPSKTLTEGGYLTWVKNYEDTSILHKKKHRREVYLTDFLKTLTSEGWLSCWGQRFSPKISDPTQTFLHKKL